MGESLQGTMSWTIEKVESEETGEEALVVTMQVNKANFFSVANLDAMEAALDRLDSEPELQGFGIVLAVPPGNKVFSAGLDLKHVSSLTEETFNEYINRFDRLIWRLWQLPRPVVAAVTGHAMAGGFCLMAAADERIALDKQFQIGMNEVHMPALLPLAATAVCRYAVGTKVLRRLLLRGEFFTPTDALQMGIVDSIEQEPELLMQTANTRAALPAGSIAAYAEMKKELQRPIASTNSAERNAQVFAAFIKKNSFPGMAAKL